MGTLTRSVSRSHEQATLQVRWVAGRCRTVRGRGVAGCLPCVQLPIVSRHWDSKISMFCPQMKSGSRGSLMAWQAPFPRWLHNAKAANVELTVNRVSDGKGQEAILKSPTVPTVRCLLAFSTLNSIHSLTPVTLFFDFCCPTSRSFGHISDISATTHTLNIWSTSTPTALSI